MKMFSVILLLEMIFNILCTKEKNNIKKSNLIYKKNNLEMGFSVCDKNIIMKLRSFMTRCNYKIKEYCDKVCPKLTPPFVRMQFIILTWRARSRRFETITVSCMTVPGGSMRLGLGSSYFAFASIGCSTWTIVPMRSKTRIRLNRDKRFDHTVILYNNITNTFP